MVKEGSGRECISRGILAKQAAVIKVGSKSFDQKEGVTYIILDYLKWLCHTTIFVSCLYPSKAFITIAYGRIFLHKCIDKNVVQYIDRSLHSVSRWIRRCKLKAFSACVVDDNERVIIEFLVQIQSLFIQVADSISNYRTQIAILKRNMERSLLHIFEAHNEVDRIENKGVV
ncbi:unnamed protein product [Dracunculus medinensis]|uniref:DUF4371 domain-containing protein n=1 Tax=Dracunculus medinensis TaxID=318479 RepID=A0A0N4UEM1_DRAME|nr:unnamed protein product [Dracunculus medinensis]